MMMFRKAERKQAKLRLALCAPSGAGKTYSALLIAKGLGGKIALCDTEHGSGDLYANLFDYDVAPIVNSFEPKKYIDIIEGAEKAGYNVLIIDSLSHAWSGEGGILSMVDMASKSSKSQNSYTAWRDVTPQHNELVDAILQSKLHVIVTMRTKTAYEMQKDGNGKTKPVKIGLAPIQRDGMEYEFTVVMDISVESHVASASKDRTQLFDGKNFLITEETGKKLLTWLNDGTSQEEVVKRQESEITVKFSAHKAAILGSNTLDELQKNWIEAYKVLKDTKHISDITEIKDKRKSELTMHDPNVMTLEKALYIIKTQTTLTGLTSMSQMICNKFAGDDDALAKISAECDLKKEELAADKEFKKNVSQAIKEDSRSYP